MKFILTEKLQVNKRGKDKKNRSYLTFFLNGIKILKQKYPYDESYSCGDGHVTYITNVYLLNGRIHQTRTKHGQLRQVSFPISRDIVKDVPKDLKITLT